jgi:uncharacterized OsmC-like protein
VKFSAQVKNSEGSHHVLLATGENQNELAIAPKATGFGSSVNGGELLFLALATCYCNDLYREAQKQNIPVKSVQVDVEGEFDGVPGHPAQNVVYHVLVEAEASEEAILALVHHTDTVAEIQNTLRQLNEVRLGKIQVVSAK